MEIGWLLLAEVRRVAANALLGCRRGVWRLGRGVVLVEMTRQAMLRVLLVLLRKQAL